MAEENPAAALEPPLPEGFQAMPSPCMLDLGATAGGPYEQAPHEELQEHVDGDESGFTSGRVSDEGLAGTPHGALEMPLPSGSLLMVGYTTLSQVATTPTMGPAQPLSQIALRDRERDRYSESTDKETKAKKPRRKRKSPPSRSDDKRFVCETCGYSTNHNWILKRHHLTHTGEKPFMCELCGKSFRQKAHLVGHKNIHAGEKNWKCEVCSESFRRADTYKKHLKTHANMANVATVDGNSRAILRSSTSSQDATPSESSAMGSTPQGSCSPILASYDGTTVRPGALLLAREEPIDLEL